MAGVSIVSVQLATQGLHAALDQPCRGSGTSPQMLRDVGERPALQVAQSNRLALVIRQNAQGLHQLMFLLSPDGLLTGGRKAAVELLFQRRHTPVGIVHGTVPPHVTLLEESVVPDRAGNL